MTGREIPSGDRRRGQTLPDFTVAIAIFLITVAFITLFVPQITQPFDDQEQPVVAERITGELANGAFAEEGTAAQLDESATIDFFDTNENGGDVLDFVGIDRAYNVNVTIRDAPSQSANSTILCYDGTEVQDCDNGGDKLQIGEEIPEEDRAIATTRQTLFVGDRVVVLEVGVW